MTYADAHGRYAKAILIDSQNAKKEREVVEQCEAALQETRRAIIQHQREHGCGETTLSATPAG